MIVKIGASLGLAVLSMTTAIELTAETATVSHRDEIRNLTVSYQDSEEHTFSASEKAAIEAILSDTYDQVKAIYPDLADEVSVSVRTLARDLTMVGHVTGMAAAPGRIVIMISSLHPESLEVAARDGLAGTFAHELHHLRRGWTIEGNHYGPGIQIATINEGLAVIFAESITGVSKPGNMQPDEPTSLEWAREIRELPVDADYGTWMFQHPDGRMGVGYRTGRFLVQRAMENSGLDIVALSEQTPDEIWAWAEVE
ncbi:MAG: hypothetical protein JJ884_10130 [Maricaulis sp.]|uniref:DUF2268 domain-containing putative Zn-dependent protease n=1 Tax=Maricaulis sp. TaxID=1486257 RepID=UPI001B06EAA0|nr:DUF2268 domain-containing putative Zn-dependent protease [Maricaulis sp.]MBO6728934.1 hypothetical protein [Maricaulis sp.]MBO6847863.1 hypothetical protein [Maricaulis sp.]MBO6877486.1 hypothetical protein [Maricaulis sp.]